VSISAQANAEKASGVVRCLRGERVRHEEDDTESPKLKPERKRAAIGQGSVGALRDEIPEKVGSEPEDAGTDGPGRRRGAETPRRGGPAAGGRLRPPPPRG